MSDRETLIRELIDSGMSTEIAVFVTRSAGIRALSDEALRRAVEIVRALAAIETGSVPC